MNLKEIGTQLLYTTIPIWVEKETGGVYSGTAFIYMKPSLDRPEESVVLLITNYHIVENAKLARIELVERQGDDPIPGNRIGVEIGKDLLLKYVNPTDDLVAVPFAPILNQLGTLGKYVFFRSIDQKLIPNPEVVQKLAAIEDVTFIGYPSGVYDKVNGIPIIRRGITATPIWNDYLGQPIFLIDAQVFPGSSGSPVFIFNQGSYTSGTDIAIGTRILFLGILSETIIRKESSSVYLGLGKVIKAHRLQEFVESIISTFPK
jgi:hypothetical protein